MKTPKTLTGFRLTEHARAELKRLAEELGISQAAFVELAIREKAAKMAKKVVK